MITYQTLDVEYDSVVVFDLLSQKEREKHKVSETLQELFKKKGMPLTIKYLSTKKDIVASLNKLLEKVKQGQKFMFHFVGHGNKNCIAFKETSEIITWEELGSLLTQLNEDSGNTLILNMTSCFGLHSIKTVNPFSEDSSPFFGLIGYSEKLKFKAAKSANDIFYTSLFSGMKINQAVSQLHLQMGDKNFHCITSQGYSVLKRK